MVDIFPATGKFVCLVFNEPIPAADALRNTLKIHLRLRGRTGGVVNKLHMRCCRRCCGFDSFYVCKVRGRERGGKSSNKKTRLLVAKADNESQFNRSPPLRPNRR